MAYDMYQEMILQAYRTPKNFGPLDSPDLEGSDFNPSCGDHIEIRLKLDPSHTQVREVRFTGDGCAISVASASMLTEHVAGRPLSEVARMTRDEVLQWLGIPLSPVRVKCALTGFTALGKALHSAGPEGPSAASAPTDP